MLYMHQGTLSKVIISVFVIVRLVPWEELMHIFAFPSRTHTCNALLCGGFNATEILNLLKSLKFTHSQSTLPSLHWLSADAHID